jgi:hypothetical protein
MISKQQYAVICMKGLGLRVNADTTAANMKAASYAMCTTSTPKDALNGEPAGWADKLNGTLEHILEFDNCVGKYLAIVSVSHSDNYEYKGCFPKCSSKPTVIHAAMAITKTTTAADMSSWVTANLPVK